MIELDEYDNTEEEQDHFLHTETSEDTYWAMLLRRGEIQRFNEEVQAMRPSCKPNISWSRLSHLDLRGANLASVYLFGSDLTGSDLRGGDFTGATLNEVVFTNADLREATGLTCEQLTTATGLVPKATR